MPLVCVRLPLQVPSCLSNAHSVYSKVYQTMVHGCEQFDVMLRYDHQPGRIQGV